VRPDSTPQRPMRDSVIQRRPIRVPPRDTTP
jgi:hypothetical protein